MIDIHNHLLPGVDDGATTLEAAVAMCRQAFEEGCEALIATPHQFHAIWENADSTRLRTLLRQVQDALGERPRLHLGAEIRADEHLLTAPNETTPPRFTPLAESRYLLIELNHGGVGPDPESLIHELCVAGWQPILAHPELFSPLAYDSALWERLVSLGAQLQITAMSVTGDFGHRPQRTARQLLDRGLVQYVASDAHDLTNRPPGLAQARREIAQGWGDAAAQALTFENAGEILKDAL